MNNARTFYWVWGGQSLSALGSSIQGFAIGVWIYQHTGSLMNFSMAMLCALLPQLLLAPLAGVFVDRHSRRHIMMLCDLGAALCALGLFGLLRADALQMHYLYGLSILTASLSCFHQLAYSASVSVLVPEPAKRPRANGLVQLGMASAFVAGPVLAGFLLSRIGLQGIALLDSASFLIALSSLALVQFPAHNHAQSAKRDGFWQDFRQGLAYFRGRWDLLLLLSLVAACNFAIAFLQVLFTPMVLTVSTQEVLGILLSIAGTGMIAGGLASSLRLATKRPLTAVWLGLAVCGLCMSLAGMRAAVPLWGATLFVFFAAIPVVNANLQGIWQHQVAPAFQGRVFAVRSLIASICAPLAYVLSPWLASGYFEPWLSSNGALATSLGAWFGTGQGRGMGVMFTLMGCVLLILALCLAANRRLHKLGTAAAAPGLAQTEAAA